MTVAGTTICWVVIHHATAPLIRGAARVAHIARRAMAPDAHRAGHALTRVRHVSPHPHVWFDIVCKVVPAAVVGGGLLIPHPANPPDLRDPPALVRPAPVVAPFLPWNGHIPPTVAAPPFAPSPADVPEPSTVTLLLAGAGGVVVVRGAIGWVRRRFRR